MTTSAVSQGAACMLTLVSLPMMDQSSCAVLLPFNAMQVCNLHICCLHCQTASQACSLDFCCLHMHQAPNGCGFQ